LHEQRSIATKMGWLDVPDNSLKRTAMRYLAMCPPAATLMLALAASCQAAEPATPAPPAAPPPIWQKAVPVTVAIGADVASGVDGAVLPTPLILRIADLSRLPRLEGKFSECVFEADAWSNLAAERVNVNPRVLRCFDAEGKETLTRPVRGFAVDKDARAGLKSPVVWTQAARELLLAGVGTQAKQNFLMRTARSALGKASLGLTDNFLDDSDDKKPVDADAIRQIRSADTLLPTLGVEPGREFSIVLSGGVK